MLITAQWYNKSEQAPRYAFWHAAPGVGQVIGALLSFAFQAVPKNYPVTGWRLMFIALGIVTVLMGIVDWFLLPDSPMTARFLNDREKVALLNHVSINMTGVENRKINPRQLWEAVKDIQMWLLSLGLLLVSPGNRPEQAYANQTHVVNHVYRLDHDIFHDSDQKHGFQQQEICTTEHASRCCQRGLQSFRRVRDSQNVASIRLGHRHHRS